MNASEIPTRPLKRRTKNVPVFVLGLLVVYCAFATTLFGILAARLIAPLTGYRASQFLIPTLVILAGLATGFYLSRRVQQRTWIIALSLSVNAFSILAVGWVVETGMRFFSKPNLMGGTMTAAAAFFLPSLFTGAAVLLAVRQWIEGAQGDEMIAILSRLLVLTIGGCGTACLAAVYLFLPWIGLVGSLKFLAFGWACFAFYFLNRYQKAVAVMAMVLCLVLPSPRFWSKGWIRLEGLEGEHTSFSVVSDGVVLRLDAGVRLRLAETQLGSYQSTLAYTDKMIELSGNVYNRRVLVIGGAGHILAHALENRGAQVIEAGIDPASARLSDRFFQPIQGTVEVIDGRSYLQTAQEEAFDVIIIDMDGQGHILPHLATVEFFTLISSRLAEDGRLVYHLNGFPGVEKNRESYGAFGATLLAVFYQVCAPILEDSEPYGILFVASQETLFDVGCTPISRVGRLLTDDRNPLLFFIQVYAGKVRQ